MILFSLFLFPLVSLWLISSDSSSRGLGEILIELKNYFLPGILFFIPAAILTKLLTGFLNATYTAASIYLYHFFSGYFFYQIFCIIFCLLRFRNSMYSTGGERILQYFIFIAGFFTAYLFISAISNINKADFYTLFLMPVTFFIMAVCTSFFLAMRDSETGVFRWIFTFALILLPFLLVLVPFFFYMNFAIVSYIAIALIIGGGVFFFYKNNASF